MKRTIKYILLSLYLVNLNAAQVTNITSTQNKGNASVFFSIKGPFTHRVFTLTNPYRVVIDLNNTNLAVDVSKISINNNLIKQARSGMASANTLRMVFELNQYVHANSSPWSPNGSIQGVKVDFIGTGTAAKAASVAVLVQDKDRSSNARSQQKTNTALIQKIAAVPSNQTKLVLKAQAPTIPYAITHNTPVRVPNSPARTLRDVIVVIDAGHGGKDPGARGPRKSKEKDVVLAISMKLKQLIDRQPGMRAVLTRSGDYYIELRERLSIARKYNGDIFVSIHADAFNNPNSSGASVFALSQGGATSEAARWIAEKENYSELGGVNLGDLDDSNGIVRSVLIDLSQTATINSSLEMGGRVLGQLQRFARLHNHRVEQARFMVLKSPDIPSILVETGFISNPIEEKNLTSSFYQTRLSQAIFDGLKGYFWTNPPQGTRIEAMTNSRFHLVRHGETLAAIAGKYRVALAVLESLNPQAKGHTLNPGQKLFLPA